MSLSRPWPTPQIDRTFHLVGDVQGVPYLGSKTNRCDQVLDDMARPSIPNVAHTLQVGDFVSSTALDANFALTEAFMDEISHDGDWWATVGNHDHERIGHAGYRTPAEAAALMGMPGENYVVDLGYIVLVSFYVWAWGTTGSYDQQNFSDYVWLTDTLDEHAGRTVMVIAHPPMRDTFSPTSNAPDMLLNDDTSVRSILDSRPWVKAWLCGHTHSPLIYPVAQMVNLGARSIAQINGSALLNESPGVDWYDPIRSLYVTVNDDSLDVRFRDHGTHHWVGGTPTSANMVSLPM